MILLLFPSRRCGWPAPYSSLLCWCCCWRLWLFWTTLLLPCTLSSSSSSSSSSSPIPNWDPSWAASSAQGTTVAVSCCMRATIMGASGSVSGANEDDNDDDNDSLLCNDGLVLLIRSMEDASKQQLQIRRKNPLYIATSTNTAITEESAAPFVSILQPDDSHNDANNVQISKDNNMECYYHNVIFRQQGSSMIDDMTTRRWTLLGGGGETGSDGSTTICCMTGFCADVDYLTRVLLQAVDTHLFIHEGSCAASLTPSSTAATTTPLPTFHLVKLLAQELHQATLDSNGGRPFGVQTLLIGTVAAANAAAPRRQRRHTIDTKRGYGSSDDHYVWQIWTLDPGGGMRHWGGGASAIGRQAALVRKHLAREFQEDNNNNNDNQNNQNTRSRRRSPQRALEMALTACRNAMPEEEHASYKAILFWYRRDRLCIGQILPEDVEKCQERIRLDAHQQQRKQV